MTCIDADSWKYSFSGAPLRGIEQNARRAALDLPQRKADRADFGEKSQNSNLVFGKIKK
jgi:hypothetical protein